MDYFDARLIADQLEVIELDACQRGADFIRRQAQRIAELEKALQPPPPTPAQLRLLANVEKFEKKIGSSPERIPHENYTLGWRYASPEIQGEFSAFSAEQQ